MKAVPPRSTRETLVKGKMEERKERESDSKRRDEKWQICWCYRDQQGASTMAQASAEKLEHTGPAEKERMFSLPQRKQLASVQELTFPKRKETNPSVQSTRSQGGIVKVSESRTLARERDESESMERRGWTLQ